LGNVVESDGSELRYRIKIGIWNIDTLISADANLSYSHIIFLKEHKPVNISSVVISPGAGIDFLRWLGIGKTSWILSVQEDIPQALDSLELLCNHFITAVPSLLKNLNLQ
jgi:hypothetical protein